MPPKTSSRSPAAWLVDTHLERPQLRADASGEVDVVGGDAGDEGAVADVHGGEKLASVSTATMESSGPKGSAWCSAHVDEGSTIAAGAT